MTNPTNAEVRFVICISNADYPASLEVRKIYQALPDAQAADGGFLRVIDESGEDYLYPHAYFTSIELPTTVKEALFTTA